MSTKSYFKIRWFDDESSKKVFIGLNVLLACLAVIHFGYTGIFGQMKYYYTSQDSWYIKSISDIPGQQGKKMTQAMKSYGYLFNSYIAYYAIEPIVQITTNVIAILMILEIIGTSKRLIWARIIFTLFVFQFGFNFIIAISSSINVTFFSSSFSTAVDSYINQVIPKDHPIKSLIRTINNFMGLSIAEVILTWLLAIPISIIMMIAMLDGMFQKIYGQQIPNEQTLNHLQLGTTQQKINSIQT